MIALLIKLLPLIAPAIRYADDPNRPLWRVDLLLYTLIVWMTDMVLAHLFFVPRKGEWTISHTLERTAYESPSHLALAQAINHISSNHIKSI
jgi:hypothetical protein